MNQELIDGLSSLKIEANSMQLNGLETYLNELKLFNSSLKLVGDPEEQWVSRHVLDSLAPLALLKNMKHQRLADLGSGAGLPGLLLALFMQDSEIFLVERMGSRCGFLRNAAVMMGLKNVEVMENQISDVRQEFDLVVMRAFLPLQKIEKELVVMAGKGKIAAYKGRKESIMEELGGLKILSANPEIIAYDVPFLQEERHLVVFQG